MNSGEYPDVPITIGSDATMSNEGMKAGQKNNKQNNKP